VEHINLLLALQILLVPIALSKSPVQSSAYAAPAIINEQAMSSHVRASAAENRCDSLSLNSSPSGWTKSATQDATGLQAWQPAILIRTIVNLTWTAPGDDFRTGKASTYEFRYSLQPLTAENWSQATRIVTNLVPATAGTTQSLRVMGLPANQRYYFGVKTADETPNWSPISNIRSDTATTVIAICGDVDGNGTLSISDEISLVAFIFGAGPRPDPLQVADMDCSGYISVTDAVYFINFIFHGGKPPCCVK
jgi:hypothetical protein